MHYAVPRILARAGMLERLYTDLYASSRIQRVLNVVPSRIASVARVLGRQAPELPPHLVDSFPAFGLEYALRLRLARNAAASSEAFLWAGARFCELVRKRGLGRATAVYTYNDAALEILVHARSRGMVTVLEQTIAPLAIEAALLDAERAKYPGWEPHSANAAVLERRCLRQQDEWMAADLILCGSHFVVDGIRKAGGSTCRCAIVPYGIDSTAVPRIRAAHSPLRVLTVGAVGLRKGAPYVLAAAKALGGAAEFKMLGPVAIADSTRAKFEGHVQILGAVPRSEVALQYEWADAFLLPSLCEGSATAIYEALAAGLPVVCTPNCGSVVTDGQDGFIVPPADHEPIVERLLLCREPGVLESMSAAALETARRFTVDDYALRLLDALDVGVAHV